MEKGLEKQKRMKNNKGRKERGREENLGKGIN